MQLLCHHCTTPNIPNTAVCSHCGSPLLPDMATGDSPVPHPDGQLSVPDLPTLAMPIVTQMVDTPICSTCDAPYKIGELFCDNCGAKLFRATSAREHDNYGEGLVTVPPVAVLYAPLQSQIPLPSVQKATLAQPKMTPRLVLPVNNVVLPFPGGKAMWVIGREDPVTGHFPELNLGPYGAERMGVSRSHARFLLEGTQMFIEDMRALNYTFVNQQKLASGTRHRLRHGDEIRLSKMVVHFYLHGS
ncbi:MAG: FHA domain-containing protein [Chloroflexi bacterium]|nr:FHA domain-containing protein [Chloroflexota bacterium]MBP8058751.1 FHA domain-containing protein [Chloroflexota bacterium]